MEAVIGNATVDISFEGTCLSCPAHMRMAGNAIYIVSHEHRVVIVRRLVNHPRFYKSMQHAAVEPSVFYEIRIDTAYIIILQRKLKRLFLLHNRGRCAQRTITAAEQKLHCLRVALIIKPADKINGVAADLLILMKPQVSSDCMIFDDNIACVWALLPIGSQSTNQVHLAQYWTAMD